MTRIYLVQQESVIEMLRLHKKNPRKKKPRKKKTKKKKGRGGGRESKGENIMSLTRVKG